MFPLVKVMTVRIIYWDFKKDILHKKRVFQTFLKNDFFLLGSISLLRNIKFQMQGTTFRQE